MAQKLILQILAHLGPAHVGPIQERAKLYRESFTAKTIVKDYSEYIEEITAFYRLYLKWYQNHDPLEKGRTMDSLAAQALAWAKRHLEKYEGGDVAAERNAQSGRRGGMITVIDTISESIENLKVRQYIEGVLLKFIEPGNYPARKALAKEFLDEFGHLLDKELLLPDYAIAPHLEIIIQNHLYQLERLRDYVK